MVLHRARRAALPPDYPQGEDVGDEPYTDPVPPQPETLTQGHDAAWPQKDTPMEPDEITVRDALSALGGRTLEPQLEHQSGLDTARFAAACTGLGRRRRRAGSGTGPVPT